MVQGRSDPFPFLGCRYRQPNFFAQKRPLPLNAAAVSVGSPENWGSRKNSRPHEGRVRQSAAPSESHNRDKVVLRPAPAPNPAAPTAARRTENPSALQAPLRRRICGTAHERAAGAPCERLCPERHPAGGGPDGRGCGHPAPPRTESAWSGGHTEQSPRAFGKSS